MLKPIDDDMIRLTQPRNFVSFTCCDGHQFSDKQGHLQEVLGDECTIHPPSMPGGAVIFFDDRLAMHRPSAIWSISTMLRVKDAHILGLYVHAPCAMAMGLGLDLNALVKGLTEAKRFLMGELEDDFPGLRILRFVHLDRTDRWQHKSTYFVDNHES